MAADAPRSGLMHFDIVHAGDIRFRGGASSAIRVEMAAASRFGLTSALLPLVGSRGRVRRFDKRTAETFETLNIPWLTGNEPVECDVVLAQHPFSFQRMPFTPIRVRAKRVVCVAQHPPFNGYWTQEYDFAVVQRNLERMFGAPVFFAPVGPKVREQFEDMVGEKPTLLRRDLFNMIDMSEWPERVASPPRGTAIVGRHSRNDPLKWPDTEAEVRGAYPDAANLKIKVLGGVPEEIKPWIGSNWSILPFLDDGIPEFLSKLDFYVFFHSRRWVEAFGISVAEAMASGAVTVLDQSFEELFEEGAVYARPEDTLDLVSRFVQAPDDFHRQSQAGRNLVARKFSVETYPQRMRELYENLELPLPAALADTSAGRLNRAPKSAVESTMPAARVHGRIAAGKRRVLFVATNGLGLGHITRLMAIAERMSTDVEPVFATMSAGSSLVHARGHMVDYFPSAERSGVTEESWNRAYAQELLTTIEAFGAEAVVFDSNYPFPGLVSVLEARPDIAWVWVRRGMWPPHHPSYPVMNAAFDMVIEPGEFAYDEDGGVTAALRSGVVAVPPILLVDNGSRLPREAAARALGVDAGRTIAVIQLGSERNFDFTELRNRIIADLVARDIQVVEVLNPLAAPPGEPIPGTRRVSIYPLAEYFAAIDLMVTNAGYNSFHECIHGGVPTIFVPNEAPVMDDQYVRAAYARSAGLGLCLRTSELARVADTIELALSAEFRAEHRRRTGRLGFQNGAAEAAAAIEELIFSVRTDRPLSAAVARV
jgi:UDP:flavonoid glycosyltransferase YjiC (YdhE family)